MSFVSSIHDLGKYALERFPPWRFLPLAGYLAFAVGDGSPLPLPGRIALLLSWLFQFRLTDDLADRTRDRLDHPDRLLVQVDPRPFIFVLLLLVCANTISTAWLLPGFAWAYFLGLTTLLAAWYRVPHRNSTAWGCLVVLAKYPAFVLLMHPRIAPALTAEVYATFVAHEVLHDATLGERRLAPLVLTLAMLTMVATAAATLDTRWRTWFLVSGCLVLSWLAVGWKQGRKGYFWPELVFVVSCVWILGVAEGGLH